MKTVCKYFDELTLRELYELLRVRAEIFVVEQDCPYQDLDRIDYDSLHLFYEEDGEVLACLRIFEPEPGTAQIGRVLTKTHGTGLGGRLLKEGVRITKEVFAPRRIVLHAQCYAVGYYEKAGFSVCSEVFPEDGIPHVCMEIKLC